MLRRVLTGSALSIITMFANIIVAMAMMPFIIHSLGNDDYGLWVLVASFIGYYGLLDFGMSTATTRFISRADGRHDTIEMNTVINTSATFFATLGLIVLVISSIVALNVETTKAAILWMTIGITSLFHFGLRGFYGLFFARIRQDIMSYTALTKLLVRTGLIVYFLNAGYGVVAVAVITMATEIINYAVDMFLLRRIAPDMKLSGAFVKPSQIKQMLHYGAFSMLTQISDLLRLRALPLIVTSILGVGYVVFFSIAIRLMEIYYQVVEKAIHILVPVFSQYEGQGNGEQIKRLFWFVFRINLILSVIVGAGIIIFADPFIAWWISPEYSLASEITVWLAVGFLALTSQEAGKAVLFGISKHQQFAWMSAFESAFGAGLTTLAYIYGPIWVAYGIAASMIAVELFVKPAIISDKVGLSLRKYYTTMLEVAITLGTPLLAYGYLISEINVESITAIVGYSTLMIVASVPFAWLALDRDSKEIIKTKFLTKVPLVKRMVAA